MIRRIGKFFAYTIGVCIILLAIAVGLLRIAMPQLPQYQDEIRARIAATISGDFDFRSLDARWRLRGPEIVFTDVKIGPEVAQQAIAPLRMESMVVGLSVPALIFDRVVRVRHVGVYGLSLELTRGDEYWSLQDFPLTSDVAGDGRAGERLPGQLQPIDIRLDDVLVRFSNLRDQRAPVSLTLDDATLQVRDDEVRLDFALREVDARRGRADLLLTGRVDGLRIDQLLAGDWTVSAEAEELSAGLMQELLPERWRLPTAGIADFVADAQWTDGRVNAVSLTLDASGLVPSSGGAESKVQGRAEWTRRDDGWLSAITDFVVGVSDRQWPAASMTLVSSTRDAQTRLALDAANITVYDLPYLADFLPPAAADALLQTEIAGSIIDANGFVLLASVDGQPLWRADAVIDYDLDARFAALSVAPMGRIPGFSNLSGELKMSPQTGRLSIDSSNARLRLPAVFDAPLELERLSGTLIWRAGDNRLSLVSDAIELNSGPLISNHSLQLELPRDDNGAVIDLRSEWSIDDLGGIAPLMPTGVMSEKLATWLSQALPTGRLRDGRLRLSGPLSAFPFESGGGEFSVSAEAEDVTMRYAARWPAVTGLDATITLEGMRLATVRNSGQTAGLNFTDSEAVFDDLRSGELSVRTRGQSSLETMYAFAAESPLRGLFGASFEHFQVSGAADYDVTLNVPLKAIPEFTVDASLTPRAAGFALDNAPVRVTQIDGQLRIDRAGVYAEGISALLFGEPVTLAAQPAPEGSDRGIGLTATGTLTGETLVNEFKVPLAGRLEGRSTFDASIVLPKARPDGSAPQPLLITMNAPLDGLAIDLPSPAGKPADGARPAIVQLTLDESMLLDVNLDRALDMSLLFERDRDAGTLALERGTLHLGRAGALLPLVPGLFVDGRVERLRLNEWLALNDGGGSGLLDRLRSISLQVSELLAFGQRVTDVQSTLQSSDQQWLIRVDAPAIAGNILLPKDLSGIEPVRMEMQRLRLLESDPADSEPGDPTALPAMIVRAGEFQLGEKRFGALEADINKTDGGILITTFNTRSEAFSIDASGDWLLDPVETLGSRTRINAVIESSDVKGMMSDLGYAPGINANQLAGSAELSWGGGPREDFVAELDGSVTLSIVNGTLDDVEPGAGRVVGLMSVAELPRRLALDFRDVFRKGFSFDEINGDFRIVNGDAYTCNLSLKGSSADVGLIGRASLDKRNYNQTAVVSVKVGNTLPAVGAVVAGPQVGAALLIFSQIFKKPLQGMTEVFYQINGGWDEPSIERTDSARFAATAELAGCLVDSDAAR